MVCIWVVVLCSWVSFPCCTLVSLRAFYRASSEPNGEEGHDHGPEPGPEEDDASSSNASSAGGDDIDISESPLNAAAASDPVQHTHPETEGAGERCAVSDPTQVRGGAGQVDRHARPPPLGQSHATAVGEGTNQASLYVEGLGFIPKDQEAAFRSLASQFIRHTTTGRRVNASPSDVDPSPRGEAAPSSYPSSRGAAPTGTPPPSPLAATTGSAPSGRGVAAPNGRALSSRGAASCGGAPSSCGAAGAGGATSPRCNPGPGCAPSSRGAAGTCGAPSSRGLPGAGGAPSSRGAVVLGRPVSCHGAATPNGPTTAQGVVSIGDSTATLTRIPREVTPPNWIVSSVDFLTDCHVRFPTMYFSPPYSLPADNERRNFRQMHLGKRR